MKNKSPLSNYLDEDLVLLVQKGNSKAFGELYRRYYGLFHTLSYSFMNNNHIPHLYLEDFISVATDSLTIAIEKYNIGQTRFVSFWWSIVVTKFKNYYAKNADLQLACNEDNFLEQKRNKMQDVEAISGYEYNPLSEEIIWIINSNINKFTQDEVVYLQFAFMGYKATEIGQITDWKKSKLFRIRKSALNKLNMIIKSN